MPAGIDQNLAIVARGPLSEGGWKLEEVDSRPIEDDELLVRIVASGICHTDIHVGSVKIDPKNNVPSDYYPRILGHEGSGYVLEVGKSVTSAEIGDPVLLSFISCGKCYSCDSGHPGYCPEVPRLNFVGTKPFRTKGVKTETIGGGFFGQSSFSKRAIVKDACVVNVKSLVQSEDELKLLAPLGCAVQTGAGTAANVGKVKAGDTIAVMGLGGVGLSAIMAAKLLNCKTIIGIDRVESRLDLAKSLGATHVFNTSDTSLDFVSQVKEATDGVGVRVAIDTTGVHAIARRAVDFTRNYGKVIQVGIAQPGAKWDISMADFMPTGIRIMGAIEGDAVPRDFIPKLIQWYKDGKLPMEKMVKFYPFSDFQQALDDMHSGKVVKPVLTW